jgi:hypothetical protein
MSCSVGAPFLILSGELASLTFDMAVFISPSDNGFPFILHSIPPKKHRPHCIVGLALAA